VTWDLTQLIHSYGQSKLLIKVMAKVAVKVKAAETMVVGTVILDLETRVTTAPMVMQVVVTLEAIQVAILVEVTLVEMPAVILVALEVALALALTVVVMPGAHLETEMLVLETLAEMEETSNVA